MSDYKGMSRLFILKVTTEHAASDSKQFGGRSVKLYVYKMLKDN